MHPNGEEAGVRAAGSGQGRAILDEDGRQFVHELPRVFRYPEAQIRLSLTTPAPTSISEDRAVLTNVPDIHPSASWFIVLPDNVPGNTMVEGLLSRTPSLRSIDHPSGRPWLIGRWSDSEVVVAQLGDHHLAVLGEHRLTGPALARLARGARTAAELCDAARGQPGSFHLVASTPDGGAIQGSISGLRRVFYASTREVTVVGDRADVVAGLTGAAVDDEGLAIRLLSPYAPWPLLWRSAWRGVSAVRPDERLLTAAGGGIRTVSRWRPPEAVLPLRDAGARLRAALTEAVQVRAGVGGLSTDLSGMDSTSLFFLAAAGGAPGLVALTCVNNDPLDDDLPWATRAAEAFGDVRHEVVDADDLPVPYEGVLDRVDRFDEPTTAVIYRAGFLVLSDRARTSDAQLRLTGFGGDELLTAEPSLQLSMLRSHPWTALRHLRLLSAAYRWPRRATLRAILDRRDYRTWLGSLTGHLAATDRPSTNHPFLGWGTSITVAPWTSADGLATLREALATCALDAQPLAADAGTHGRLVGIYAGAANSRHLDQMTRRVGVPAAFPYFDDGVIEAGLCVRLPDVTDPRDYKPLIRSAMSGIVPDELLARSGKADTSIAAENGALRHREQLQALAEDSRLAARGLIDPARLRAAMHSPTERTWYELDQTLACETWLRVVEAAAVPG